MSLPPLDYSFNCNLCNYPIVISMAEAAMETCCFCPECNHVVPIPDPQTP